MTWHSPNIWNQEHHQDVNICSLSHYPHSLKIHSYLWVISLTNYNSGYHITSARKCVLTQKLEFTANRSDCSASTSTCSVSTSTCSMQCFRYTSLSLPWIRLAKTGLCCWGSVGLEQKDISGCSTARSCISCPCCRSGWAVPASVLPLPGQKPRPSGSASGWGSPLPPTDCSPCEREQRARWLFFYQELFLLFDVL